ncbi:Hypothetical_protein [Hexamita inflata]|uniref:Hypothetical_protein n=1 Tax=Hexamita inflata TaxID=28002 RepID=A0ABP1I359_9EUKA
MKQVTPLQANRQLPYKQGYVVALKLKSEKTQQNVEYLVEFYPFESIELDLPVLAKFGIAKSRTGPDLADNCYSGFIWSVKYNQDFIEIGSIQKQIKNYIMQQYNKICNIKIIFHFTNGYQIDTQIAEYNNLKIKE